jgi:MoaA/NifB/PqqE/SkfB family radical SAM enzyme/SAM-dependent methyltransferase
VKANDAFLAAFVGGVDISRFTPSLYRFFKDFLDIERVRRYGEQFVINTFIPPFPSRAFDRFLASCFSSEERPLILSVDLALTNACPFNCWHCYNAGRAVADLPTDRLRAVAADLQEVGAIVVNFTGGEPCLRHDLVEICGALREDSRGVLATTGYGFTDEMARRLRDTGVYSICISLDSADEQEHDQKRGVPGAFRIALQGIERAKAWGFYTYTCAVPSKRLLEAEHFERLVGLNERLGVAELQLIEPAPAGRIGRAHLAFGEEEYAKVFEYLRAYNQREGGVALTSFAHMESPEFFGCGAGQSHIYIDGTGEVCPCNMVPVSYGNAGDENLATIIERMRGHFRQPYRHCLAFAFQDFLSEHVRAPVPARADAIPTMPLPTDEELPRFYQLLQHAPQETAGREEIVLGYDEASRTYEDYWLSVAAGPINELFDRLEIKPGAHAIDCGCGTGYSTAKLSERAGAGGRVTGLDLSSRMVARARERLERLGLTNAEFRIGDVLDELERMPADSADVAVLTWLLGYVGCSEIFPTLARVLRRGGLLGFVAHLDRSPRVPIELFEAMVRQEPDILTKAVRLKFPKDAKDVSAHLEAAGLKPLWIRQGSFDFTCHTGQEVYDHVMKSGAGTTFYYAVKPSERARLAEDFVRRISERYRGAPEIIIGHEYVVGIAAMGEGRT